MGYFPFYMDIKGKLVSLQEEERLHTARYVTCFLLVQLSRSFPRNGMPGYPLWQRNRPLGAV